MYCVHTYCGLQPRLDTVLAPPLQRQEDDDRWAALVQRAAEHAGAQAHEHRQKCAAGCGSQRLLGPRGREQCRSWDGLATLWRQRSEQLLTPLGIRARLASVARWRLSRAAQPPQVVQRALHDENEHAHAQR